MTPTNPNRCEFPGCGREEAFPFDCAYCGRRHCSAHRIPERHACPQLHLAAPPRTHRLGRPGAPPPRGPLYTENGVEERKRHPWRWVRRSPQTTDEEYRQHLRRRRVRQILALVVLALLVSPWLLRWLP